MQLMKTWLDIVFEAYRYQQGSTVDGTHFSLTIDYKTKCRSTFIIGSVMVVIQLKEFMKLHGQRTNEIAPSVSSYANVRVPGFRSLLCEKISSYIMDALPFLFGDCQLPGDTEANAKNGDSSNRKPTPMKRTKPNVAPLIINRKNETTIAKEPIEPTPVFVPLRHKRAARSQSADSILSEREIRAFVRDFKDQLESNPVFSDAPKSAPVLGTSESYLDKISSFFNDESVFLKMAPSRDYRDVTEADLKAVDDEILLLKEKIEQESSRINLQPENLEAVKDRYEFQLLELRRQLADAEILNAGLEDEIQDLKNDLQSMKQNKDLREIQLENQREIQRISSILETRETNIGDLIKDAEAKQNHIAALEGLIMGKEANLIALNQHIYELESKIAELRDEKINYDTVLLTMQATCTETLANLLNAEAQLNDLCKQLHEEVSKERDSNGALLSDLHKSWSAEEQIACNLMDVEAQIGTKHKEIEELRLSLTQRIEFFENALATEQKLIKSLMFDLKSTYNIIEEQEQIVDHLMNKCAKLETEKKELESISEQMMQESIVTQDQLEDSDEIIDMLQQQLDSKTKDIQCQEKELSQAKKDLEESLNSKKEIQTKLLETAELFLAMEGTIHGVEKKLQSQARTKRNLNGEIEVKVDKIEELQEKIQALKEQLAENTKASDTLTSKHEAELIAAKTKFQEKLDEITSEHSRKLSEQEKTIDDLKLQLSAITANRDELRIQLERKAEEMQVRQAMSATLKQMLNHHHQIKCRRLSKRLELEIANNEELTEEKSQVESSLEQYMETATQQEAELMAAKRDFQDKLDKIAKEKSQQVGKLKSQLSEIKASRDELQVRLEKKEEEMHVRQVMNASLKQIVDQHHHKKCRNLLKQLKCELETNKELFEEKHQAERSAEQHKLEIQSLKQELKCITGVSSEEILELKGRLQSIVSDMREKHDDEVSTLKAELTEVREELSEREYRCDQLSEQNRIAEKRSELLQEQLDEKNEVLIKLQSLNKTTDARLVQATIELEQVKDDLQQEIDDLKQENQRLKETLHETTTELRNMPLIHNQIEQQLNDAIEKLDIREKEFEKLNADAQNLTAQLTEVREELSEREYRCDQLSEKNRMAEKRSELLQEQLDEKNEDLIKLQSLNKTTDARLVQATIELEQVKDDFQQEIEDLKQENDRLKESLHATTTELRDVPLLHNQIEQQLNDAIDQLDIREKEVERLQTEAQISSEKIQSLQKQLDAKDHELFESEMACQSSRAQVKSSERKLESVEEELKSKISELEAESERLKANLYETTESLRETPDLADDLKNVKKALNGVKFENESLKKRCSMLEKQKKRASQALKSKESVLDEVTRKLKDTQSELKELDANRKEELAVSREKLSGLQTEKSNLEEQLKRNSEELKELQFEVEALRNSKRRNETLAIDVAKLRTENSKLEKKLADKDECIESQENEISELVETLKETKEQVRKEKMDSDDLHLMQMEKEIEIDDLHQEIEDREMLIEALDDEKAQLQSKISSLEERIEDLLEQLETDIKYSDVKNIRLRDALESTQKAEKELASAKELIDQQSLELAKSRTFIREFTRKEFEEEASQVDIHMNSRNIGVQSENNDVSDESRVIIMAKDMEIERLLCQLDALKSSQLNEEDKMMKEVMEISEKATKQRQKLENELLKATKELESLRGSNEE